MRSPGENKLSGIDGIQTLLAASKDEEGESVIA
jgi:hypothetical protein